MAINDHQAFKTLFQEFYGKMCHYAFSYLKDEQSAEDVVQETFVKFWEQKKELLGLENSKYYLITAVRNNCISYLRKQKNITELSPSIALNVDPELMYLKMIAAEQQTEDAKKIAHALNQLPPKCKEVFLLVKLHGCSYKKCAEILSLSVKTIENQMTKALRIFRNL